MMAKINWTCLLVITLALTVVPALYYFFIKPPVTVPKLASTAITVNGDMKQRLPCVIIIGVKKGGTKALISTLNRHPEVVAANGEVHYFDRNYFRGVDWYLGRMPLTHEFQLTIEKSPSYFITPNVPERVLNDCSENVKLLLMVRDPVTRVISDFTQLDAKKKRKKVKRPSFEEFVFNSDGTVRERKNVITVSMYDVHFKRWLRVFKPDRFHIVNGDSFITNPYSEIVKVEQFLNITTFYKPSMFVYSEQKGFYCWNTSAIDQQPSHHKLSEVTSLECLDNSKGRPHPLIDPLHKEKLKNFFRPHNKKFCTLANVSYSWCKD